MCFRGLFVVLCGTALLFAGCAKNIVRAAPPSVTTPLPVELPPPPASLPLPPADAAGPPLEEMPPPEPSPQPARVPAPRPRPAPTETSDSPPAAPRPAPPQISPQLSPADLAQALRETNSDISTAERNLQASTGRRLNTSQNDLVEKIRDFLNQAHEAILADDWIRAHNLSQKARVLSIELVKSF
jgi:hypothetical protein